MLAFGRKCLALLLTATLLASLVGTAAAETRPSGPPTAPFWDTIGTQFQEPVNALYALGVVTGKSEHNYVPSANVNRAEMAALVMRALGQQGLSASQNPFPDVPVNHWAVGVIAGASQYGIIRGGEDGMFRPNDPVTYAQVVAMLLRAAGLESQAGTYPTGYVILANQLGLIEGLRWGMNEPATRGDVAIMLYRLVFSVKRGGSGPTLSQSVFKKAGSISIEPEGGALVAGSNRLTAKALDWVGNPLDLPVTWSIPSGNATVDSSGNVTPLGDASVTVQAAAGGLTATRSYSIIKSLTVTADKTSVASGAKVNLTAKGIAGNGQEVAVTPVWSVVSGSGTVTADGVLTVNGPSSVTVRASVSTLTAQTTIHTVGGITLQPGTEVTAAPNQDVQFTAVVTDGAGQTVNAPVTWSVEGAGRIDQNGKLHTANGPATITARSGNFTATVRVKIISRVQISPETVSLQKGGSQQMTATVFDSENRAVSGAVQWSLEPTSLGIMSKEGKIFALNSGSGYAVANYNGVTARVPVTVAGQATAIQLTASPSALPANGSSTTTITARLVDAVGNTATGAESVFFSISSNRLGTLDRTTATVENGVATATLTVGTTPGTYSIIASAPGSTLAAASMSFVTNTPSISHIALEVYPSPFAADGISQTSVIATLTDISGAPMPNTTGSVINVVLSSSNSTAGRLANTLVQILPNKSSGSTYFVASRTPSTTVISGSSIFSVRSVTASSQVVGEAYRLKIRPVTSSVKADGSSEMTVHVEVQDANGNVLTGDNTTVVSMNAVSGANSIATSAKTASWGVAEFKLKTTKSGQFTVSVWAANKGLQTDNTVVTFTPGTPHKLQLTVEPSNSLAADGRTVATLKAKILDMNSNEVTTASNQVRFIRETISQSVTSVPSVTSSNAVNGEATLQITAGTGVGSDYFHAEADGLLNSNQLRIYTRITGVPTKVAVQSLTTATVAAGTSTTVQVWVLDQLNQLVTSDNGRMITLLASNGGVVSGPTATVGGVATFTVSSTKSGGVGLTAVADGLTGDPVGRLLNVAPSTPDHILLSATPEALSADGISKVNLQAKLVDMYNNPTSGVFSVKLTPSTTEHIRLSSSSVTTGSQVQVTSTNVPGTTTVTGTASGYVVMPVTISTYIPGTPTRVVIDEVTPIQAGNGFANQAVVKARIVDNNGNLATSLNTGGTLTAMALRISGSGGNNSTNISMTNSSGLNLRNIFPNGITIGSAAVANGIASFTITNTRAETVTLTPEVYYNNTLLQSESGTLTTFAGPGSRLTLTASTTAVPVNTATTVSVTAAITDAYGNRTAATDDTITFWANSSTYFTMPSQMAISTTTGDASILITSKSSSVGGSTSITARSSKLGLSGSVAVVVDRMPDKPTVIARDSAGVDSWVTSGESAARITITASTRTSPQTVMVYVNGVVVPLYSDAEGSMLSDIIPAGGNTLTAYIKMTDLGGIGVKDIRAVISTPLGLSPLSDSATLTVSN